MPDKPAGSMGSFGSAFRTGRDNPRYQIDRLERLTAFSLRLHDAYRRRLVRQDRVGREVWVGKQWLDAEHKKWQEIAARQEQTIREMSEAARQAAAELEQVRLAGEGCRAWAAELEEAKVYQAEIIARQETTIREQADYIKQLIEAKEWLLKQLEQAQSEQKR